jgi:hypothetical protein
MKRARPSPEEQEENDNDVQNEPQEEQEHDNVDVEITTESKLNDLEMLANYVCANPEEKPARLELEARLKKLYIKHGGLPINPKCSINFDFESMTPEQLRTILDNMLININTTRKGDLIGKSTNIFTNVGVICGMKYGPIISKPFELLNQDIVFRDTLVEYFVASNLRFSPTVSLCISLASHVSNFLVAYLNGQHNKLGVANNDKHDSVVQQQQQQQQQKQQPTNKPGGAEERNNTTNNSSNSSKTPSNN